MKTIHDARTVLAGMWRVPTHEGKSAIISFVLLAIVGSMIAPVLTAFLFTALIIGLVCLMRTKECQDRIALDRQRGYR